MPIPSSPSEFEGRGHRHSLGSTTSGITASDAIFGRQHRTSNSDSQLLEESLRPISSDISSHPQLLYSYRQQECKPIHGTGTRNLGIWQYARFGIRAAVLCWVVYCTIRYFVAVQIYRGDHVRSRYALGMGIASAFTIVFFASETSITLCLLDKQCHRRLRTIIHSLAYLSSTFVLGLTIINLVLVNIWRTPHNSAQFGRSIQGRCHWGLDVVWSGTGMACAQADNKPFGGWLSAAISRSVVSALFIIAYHLIEHVHPAINGAQTFVGVDADIGGLVDRQPSIPVMRTLLPSPHIQNCSLVPVAITASEEELQRRSLSFTAAGQVLSRIQGSELDEDDVSSISSSSEHHRLLEGPVHPRTSNRDTSILLLRSESPETLSPTENNTAPLGSDMRSRLPQRASSLDSYTEAGKLAPNIPPASYLRGFTSPSNDLQDFASAFRNLVLHSTREPPDGPALDNSTRMPRSTVRVLGSYISRMSTIDSMASREASSPVRSLSGSDTNHSSSNVLGPESRNLCMDPMVLGNPRRSDDQDEVATPLTLGTSSASGHSPS